LDDKLSVHIPPHDRLAALEFLGDSLHVTFTDGRGRSVTADQILALEGGRVRNEIVTPDVPAPLHRAYSGIDPAVFTRADPGPTTGADDIDAKSVDELLYVVIVRAAGVKELWFLVADSFNFRKTLGADAGYVTEANLQLLMQRLSNFAPAAKRDQFFGAMLARLPLPPPVGSLVDLFKAA
jgi:hypothetical protein